MATIPERLGKYEILRELGAGNMARVYLGHDPFINRDVAVERHVDLARGKGFPIL